ncbi:MAG: amidohydrolase family protein [Acidimicrobiaceae bacterium]|jgi:N-acyl-D-amino-acid deacylase|nr:amidohydrolase family protein [Acidimicrobiaceae bacterium]MDA9241572.1 amidohydrolase family protein [bacterium]
MHDLVIANGMVVDGTGASARRADVAVNDGVITEVGDLNGHQAQRTIDADGHIVSPGFVDVHTHMDAQIAWDPLGECSCFHGVTTAVMGNCGFTLAPVNSDERELVVRNLERAEDISADAMAAGIDWSWETFPEYLDFVDATPKGINYAGYVGHSALRTWAMGERAFEEAANDDDITKMAAQVQASMRAGAIGFTTSVSGNHETSDDRPVASRFASRSEINALVGAMAELGRGGIFELAQHPNMRSSDPEKREDYARWLIDLAVSTGVPLTYGMLAFGTEEHKWKPVVELLDRITAEGGTAWGQAHSRHFGAILSFQTQLPFDALPVWKEFRAQPLDEQRRALADPTMRQRLIHSADTAEYGRAIGTEARKPEWQYVFPVTAGLPPYETIAELAAARGTSPMETFIDIAVDSELNMFFMQAAANHDQDRVLEFLRHPQAIPTFSDSGAHVSQIMDSSLQTHMLGHWVRNEQAFTIEQAVHRMTQVPATAWGFLDRGVIAPGMAADINVFDLETVTPDMPELVYDLPGGARRLRQTASGFKATMVNGQVLLDHGEATGARPGQLLRGRLAN